MTYGELRPGDILCALGHLNHWDAGKQWLIESVRYDENRRVHLEGRQLELSPDGAMSVWVRRFETYINIHLEGCTVLRDGDILRDGSEDRYPLCFDRREIERR